jgi:glycosyltransferase involved in cell wall biosynthesis
MQVKRTYRPKICIYSPSSYSLLANKVGLGGGAEVQMVILAKELVKKGYDVLFISYDENINIPEKLDGIRIIKTCSLRAGLPVIRFIYPKLYSLWKTLKYADADVYIKRTASWEHGVIAKYCQWKKKKYIFSASHDRDVVQLSVPIHEYENSLKYRLIRKRDNLFYRYGLRLTGGIVVQSDFQHNSLKQKMNLESKVIKNFYSPPKNKKSQGEKKYVLWMGSIHSEAKNIEFLYEIAREFPEEKFIVIGRTSRYGEKKSARFHEEFRNIKFLGNIPHSEIEQYYRGAKFYLNTSRQEGFPNTFLEAWGNCIPVVSVFVDPDEIICRHQLGFHSGSLEGAIDQIRILLSDGGLPKRFGKNGKRYVEQFHNVDKIADSWDTLIRKVLAS